MKYSEFEWVCLWTVLALLGSWIYLPAWFFVLPATVILGVYAKSNYQRRKQAYEEKMISWHFTDFLQVLAGKLNAGFNLVHGLKGTARDLAVKDGGASLFLASLNRNLDQYDGGRSLESCLKDFASDLDLPIIHSFVDSLVLGMDRGVDQADLVEAYLRVLVDIRDLEAEREAKLYAAKREQYFLFLMPFLLLLFLRLSHLVPGKMNFLDILVRLACLGLMGLAWHWCQKIINQSYLGKSP